MLAQLLGAVEGLHDFALPFEEEGDGDDADCEQAALAGDFGHHGSRAGAGAATHAGGDEHHLGAVVKEGRDIVGALLGGEAGNLGVASGSEAAGGVGAEQHAVGHRRVIERLAVGVAHRERNFVDVLLEHVVDGVVAAAPHADCLDDDILGGGFEEVGEVVYVVACHSCLCGESLMGYSSSKVSPSPPKVCERRSVRSWNMERFFLGCSSAGSSAKDSPPRSPSSLP